MIGEEGATPRRVRHGSVGTKIDGGGKKEKRVTRNEVALGIVTR